MLLRSTLLAERLPRLSGAKRFALLRPGLHAARAHVNYGRLSRYCARPVELHAYTD